jgi:signal transduction histidine kinase/BarA-like signal transduction histidine kinase
MNTPPTTRLLVIDDTPSIHDVFRKIFKPVCPTKADTQIDTLAAAIFNVRSKAPGQPVTMVDFAAQGEEGLALVQAATAAGQPYAVAFVDMRMPPGWDGLETIPHLWAADPRLQVVICTAYSDHGWGTISQRLGRSDNLIILKKPFDDVEVLQLVQALSEKWRLGRAAALKMHELEAMVARRTGELLRAKEAADQSNRAKNVFLATISHEIRTPLNGVLGMTSLLLDGELPASQRNSAQIIATSADHLRIVLNDILDVSKIESGLLAIEEIPFEPADIITSVKHILAPKAAERRLDFTAEIDPAIKGLLLGDPVRIRQILFNLVGNAIKFTDTGTITLKVRQLESTPTSLQLRFSVHDTGIGIAEEDQPRLFQTFAQLDGSSTRRFGGTGLGLSICRRLVDLMNGIISVQSQPGHGSTFTVTFNFSRFEPTANATQNVALSATLIPFAASARILVAEDNSVNQKVILQHLKRLGVQADLVADGQEAIDAMARHNYDLILMDCHMPVLDGIAATHEIRRIEKARGLRHLPIVALTAGILDREACLAAGMDDFLSKPFRPEVLRQILQRILMPGRASPP